MGSVGWKRFRRYFGPTARERLESCTIPEPNSGCLIWTGAILRNGYGELWDNGVFRYAHALAYEIAKGPIPVGLQIDHKCRVRCCVNPHHLEAVTPAENTRRGVAARPKLVRCKHGHEYTAENSYFTPDGHRECRTCRAKRFKIKFTSGISAAESA